MRYNGISLLFPILVTSVLNFVYIWRHTFKNTQFSKCVFSVNQQCVSLRHLMHSEKVNVHFCKSGKYERLFHIFIHFKSIFYFFLNQLKQLEPYAYFNHKYIYIFHVVSYNLNELGRSPLKDFLPYLIIYSVLFTILMVFHYFYFIVPHRIL